MNLNLKRVVLTRIHVFVLSLLMIGGTQSFFEIINLPLLLFASLGVWMLYFFDGFFYSPEDVFNKSEEVALWKTYKNTLLCFGGCLGGLVLGCLTYLAATTQLSLTFYVFSGVCSLVGVLYLAPNIQYVLKRKIGLKVTVIAFMWMLGTLIFPMLVSNQTHFGAYLLYLGWVRFLVFLPNLLWELHLDQAGDKKVYGTQIKSFDFYLLLAELALLIALFVGICLFPAYKIWFFAEGITFLSLKIYPFCTKHPKMLIFDVLLASGSIFLIVTKEMFG